MSGNPHIKWNIPINTEGYSKDFDRYIDSVRQRIAAMAPEEQRILADARFTKVLISAKTPTKLGSRWSAKDRQVTLYIKPHPDSQLAEFMKPLMESNFEYKAAHELYHPVIYETGSFVKHDDPEFKKARQLALERVYENSQAKEKITNVLSGMRAFLDDGLDTSFTKIDFGWNKLDSNNKEQLAVMMGVLYSDEFHEAYGYDRDIMRMRPDTRYEEMICNTKALTACYGEQALRELAPEMLDYINSLHEKRGVADEKPKGPMTAEERLIFQRKYGGGGQGGNLGR